MKERLQVLVVDDEPLARSGMTTLLEKDPELEVAAECANGRTAVEAILELQPDLVLLDIQMPEMDGFEVLRAVGTERMPPVVFVTAYDQFAVRAFEVNALDYLLKPFDDERFARAIDRAKQSIRRPDVGELSKRLLRLLDAAERTTANNATNAYDRSGTHLARLVVKDAGRVFFVRTDEIDWIQAASYYVKLHVQDKVHLLRETMNSLESRLDPTAFFRVSRSAIVNLDRIMEIQPYTRGTHVVILKDGTRVKLSKTRKERLELLLGQEI
ncbi:MAG: response regulator transcription factor [Gemmatimonadota bacterium]|nr:MAG: response regulator transcription factor [Gemmatimonadota bacterium]